MNNFPQQPQSPNIVLAIVSLALGVVGLFAVLPSFLFFLCAIFPLGLGIAAVIVGFLARSRAKNDPAHYGGAGLATGGIVVGALAVAAPIVIFVFVILLWVGMAGASQLSR